MNYDDWKTTEPDEPDTRVRCENPFCDGFVTFPDFEVLCSDCLADYERQARARRHPKQCQRVGCTRMFADAFEVYCPTCRDDVNAQQQKTADEHAQYDVEFRR